MQVGSVRPPEALGSATRLRTALALFAGLAAASAVPLAAQEGVADPPRVFATKFELAVVAGEAPGASRPTLCSARLVEGSDQLELLCRHELGSSGEVSLVRAGIGAGSIAPFWSAPLASPFEAVATLSAEAMAAFASGELALRIDTGAAGVVAEGTLGTPIFDDGFDIFSMCRWSNFPCASDGNVCTNEVCSSTGVCSHPNNTASCPLPNATGGCIGGNCAIIQSCNDGASNCDVTNTNGCEVNHNNGPGTCSENVNFVDTYPGDTVCGIICPINIENPHTFATRTGRGEAYYSAEAIESSTCLGDIEHRIDLIVPEGVNYDLYVYKNCQKVGESTAGPGLQEVVFIDATDFVGPLDDFTYQVEVRWVSGRSCEEWTLQFSGYVCS